MFHVLTQVAVNETGLLFDMRPKNAIKRACQSPDTFQDEPPPSQI